MDFSYKNYSCAYVHECPNVIGHYKPAVRIIDLVSHTTYVVCVNFLYISGGTYSLKSTPYDRFFEKLFMAIFIWLSEFLPKICRRNIFRISFWCLVWDSNLGFSSSKPTHYLLDHSNMRFYVLNATILIVYITAKIKMSFIWKDDCFAKICIFCKSISGPLTSVVQVYTYIHNWQLQSFRQDYWPSFSNHLCCVR